MMKTITIEVTKEQEEKVLKMLEEDKSKIISKNIMPLKELSIGTGFICNVNDCLVTGVRTGGIEILDGEIPYVNIPSFIIGTLSKDVMVEVCEIEHRKLGNLITLPKEIRKEVTIKDYLVRVKEIFYHEINVLANTQEEAEEHVINLMNDEARRQTVEPIDDTPEIEVEWIEELKI